MNETRMDNLLLFGVRSWARVLGALLLLALLSGCERSDNNTAAQPEVVVDAPEPAPALYSLGGSISLEGLKDPAGTIVFCAGTSYLALADSGGDYTISSVPPGDYTVLAMRANFKVAEVTRVTLNPSPTVAEPLDRFLPLTRLKLLVAAPAPSYTERLEGGPGRLTGRVGLSDGAPPETVRVSVDGTELSVFPESNGRFTFLEIPSGSQTVRFSLEGYRAVTEGAVVSPDDLTTLPRQIILVSESEMEEQEASAIVGRILFMDAQGQATEVNPQTVIRILESNQTMVISPDGSFLFEDMRRGSYTLRAEAEGFAPSKELLVEVKEEPATALLILQEEESAILGTVELENPGRESLAGSQVALTGTGFAGVTDTQGRFKLANVPAGVYTLLAFRNGYKPSEMAGIELAAGESLDIGAIRLERDVELPRVLATVPEDGARDLTILPENILRITFSKRMDLQSLHNAIRVQPEFTHAIRRVSTEDLKTDLIEIRARNTKYAPTPMRFKKNYKISISVAATDTEGNPLEEPYDFTIQTGGLKVLYTFPPSDGQNIPVADVSRLLVYFNGVVDTRTLTSRNIRVSPTPVAQSPLPSFQIDSKTGWTIFQKEPTTWAYDTRYRVSLSGSIRSVEGAGLSPAYRFEFKTQEVPNLLK